MKKEREAKEITLSIDDKNLNVELSIKDVDLIENLFDSLAEYVRKGSALKVRQSYMTSHSDSVRMLSTIINKSEQMDKWRQETKQLIAVLRKKL